jgi:hypothetical protein
MAIKANRAVEMALQELIVRGSEAPIQADEAQDAVLYMNLMMAEFAADGITLGYTQVTDLGDDLTIPDGAVLPMIKNLAVYLAAQFGVNIPVDLAVLAKSGKNTMRNIAVKIIPSRFPDTLPVGSGNEWDTYSNSHFYPDQQGQILTEQSGPILLEDDT